MAGLIIFCGCALVGAGPCRTLCGCELGAVEAAGFGLACLDVLFRYCRSSDSDIAPGTGWGESRGESPRGELVKCVPKVAPPCEFRAVAPGVVGPFGAAKGPVWVGVMALVVAAITEALGGLLEDVFNSMLARIGPRALQVTAQKHSTDTLPPVCR